MVEGLDRVVEKLRKLAAKASDNPRPVVVVGYTANYAIFVHENVEMKLAGKPRPSGLGVFWGPSGDSQFLLSPARRLSSNGTIPRVVRRAVQQGKTLAEGLLLGGLCLQRDSQEHVPVEHGKLRASAFTRLE